MSTNVRFFLLMFCLLAVFVPNHAQAQFNQCDPLNTDYIFDFDSGVYYPTLETICNKPFVTIPVDCYTLGDAFVSYSDATMLSDGTFQAFSAGEDFSTYAPNADVQIGGSVTMPDGQVIQYGRWSPHGYAMAHTEIPFDENNLGDITINAQHELNWPSCDGFGQIYLTSLTVRIGVTIEWMGLTGMIAPSVYNYTPLDHACPTKTVCGHNTDHQSNVQHTYAKEYHPWLSLDGLPPPYGTGEAFCSSINPTQYIDGLYTGPFCYDIGAP